MITPPSGSCSGSVCAFFAHGWVITHTPTPRLKKYRSSWNIKTRIAFWNTRANRSSGCLWRILRRRCGNRKPCHFFLQKFFKLFCVDFVIDELVNGFHLPVAHCVKKKTTKRPLSTFRTLGYAVSESIITLIWAETVNLNHI